MTLEESKKIEQEIKELEEKANALFRKASKSGFVVDVLHGTHKALGDPVHTVWLSLWAGVPPSFLTDEEDDNSEIEDSVENDNPEPQGNAE